MLFIITYKTQWYQFIKNMTYIVKFILLLPLRYSFISTSRTILCLFYWSRNINTIHNRSQGRSGTSGQSRTTSGEPTSYLERFCSTCSKKSGFDFKSSRRSDQKNQSWCRNIISQIKASVLSCFDNFNMY